MNHPPSVPAPVPYYPQPVVVMNQYSNGAALASLLCGIATFITFGATSIPAVVCGIVAIQQIKKGRSNATGMAVTGLVLGAVAIAGWLAYFGLIFMLYAIGSISA
jgi:Domain of unknown function (DUF4190)